MKITTPVAITMAMRRSQPQCDQALVQASAECAFWDVVTERCTALRANCVFLPYEQQKDGSTAKNRWSSDKEKAIVSKILSLLCRVGTLEN